MGARINFTNHIEIAAESFDNGLLRFIGYKDVTPELAKQIVQDRRIRYIQVSGELPEEAYQVIDGILERRQDLYFRIYGIGRDRTFDLSVLEQMPHLSRVRIDARLKENKTAVNAEYLCRLPGLKGLHLDLFDCRDYGFVKELSPDLEELVLFADTMQGTVRFDCEWLLSYKKLRSLYLGKKAKKNLESIGRMPQLKSLSLRGIKVADFEFLQALSLESFALLWCADTGLSGLGKLESLRTLELWRIMKLDNLDFICSLVNLETLKLQDLKHVTTLPDLSRLPKLRDIQIDNVPIDLNTLDASAKSVLSQNRMRNFAIKC